MTDNFKDKAKDWDANEMVVQLSSKISAEIQKQVSFSENTDVMDFGAGTGLISSQLVPLVKGIVAVDTSKAMLDQLVAKPDLKEKVTPVCQDIVATPLEKKFDLIASAMALHHVSDTDKLLARFAQNLKPGGKLALADLDAEDGSFHPPDIKGVFHFGFDRNALTALLEKNGFSGISFCTIHIIKKPTGDYPVFLVIATK